MNTGPNQRYLTKSRFKLALECPTKLYYTGKAEYANTKNDNEFLAMLAGAAADSGRRFARREVTYPSGA